MVAMESRIGDGPLEVAKEDRVTVMRTPLGGDGRLVLKITTDEVKALGEILANART